MDEIEALKIEMADSLRNLFLKKVSVLTSLDMHIEIKPNPMGACHWGKELRQLKF